MFKKIMLRWIVRKNLIRLYDVISIIIFSVAANILTGGLMNPRANSVIYYFFLILSFGFLIISGCCFYWLFENVKFYLQDVKDIEIVARNEIIRKGRSYRFQGYFMLGIVYLFFGFIFFVKGQNF